MGIRWTPWTRAGLVVLLVAALGTVAPWAAGAHAERRGPARASLAKKDDATRDPASHDHDGRSQRKLLGRKRTESHQPVVAADADEITIPGVEAYADGPPATAARGARLRSTR